MANFQTMALQVVFHLIYTISCSICFCGRPPLYQFCSDDVRRSISSIFNIFLAMVVICGNFLKNDFWAPPPPYYFLPVPFFFFLTNQYIFRIIGHVAAALGPLAYASRIARPRHIAAALGPLACPSRSARPRKCLNLT